MNKSKRPYRIPRPLLCDPAEIANGISLDLVKEYIGLHEERAPRYKYLEALYHGFHDVFLQPEKPDWKPDHRLAVNFPRYITDMFLGYSMGIPVKKSHPDESIEDAIAMFDEQNAIEEHDFEMAKKVAVFGHAFEFIYQDEQTKTRVTDYSPRWLFVVYDDTLRQKPLFAVRYGRKHKSHELFGELMTEEYSREFRHNAFVGEAVPNPYGKLPVVEWMLNSERIGIYEQVAGLVETYNHTIGEKANDVDAFAEAYLAVIGAELDEDGVHKIRDNRLINLYGTDDAREVLVQFLQRPTGDETQEHLLTRLEKLIYQMSMVPNISDESFGTGISGVAMAYKLLSNSNLAQTFFRKAQKSMEKRYKLFCSLPTNVPNTDAWKEIEFTFTKNVPRNTLEEIQAAQGVDGMVSRETQLTLLSVVPDPVAELEKMQQEQEDAAQRTMDKLYSQIQQVNTNDES